MRNEIRSILEGIASYEGDDTELLARLVQVIRPARADRAQGVVPAFDALLGMLEHHPALRQGLGAYISRLLQGRRISTTLLDAAMPHGDDLWRELRQRLAYKVLPQQPDPDTLDHLLVNVFYKEDDGDWVQALPPERCVRFLQLIGGKGIDQCAMDGPFMEDLCFTAKALALRMAGHAFDAGVLRMVPEYANLESPFVAIQAEVDVLLQGLRAATIARSPESDAYRHVLVLIAQGEELVQRAYRNAGRYGISMRVNQHLILLEHMLDRLRVVLRPLVGDGPENGDLTTVELARTLIALRSGSTRVVDLLDRSTQVIAREITQHTGRTGERYITRNRSQYMAMLRTALGGGFLVAFACIIKAWMATLDTSLLGHAVLYSLNYAWVFIAIFLLHWTLATKQPAMTASTLAAALDEAKKQDGEDRYATLSDLFARVWRSQFIAFVGNVVMVFPVALGIAWTWGHLFGPELLAHKAPKLLKELDPLASLALLHAGFAGIFLFLSGLIAGSATNKVLYRRVPRRIVEHPILKLTLSLPTRQRMAAYVERNYGGIISNFWFGVFMGSLGTVGVITGLPLDIRHITFAAGNLGLAAVGANWGLDTTTWVLSVVGVGLIGFVNFLVSFVLSLTLAMRSRGVPYRELLVMAVAAWNLFRYNPWIFYFPPITERTVAGGAVKAMDEVH